MTKKRTVLPEINENLVENKEKRDQNRKEKKKIDNRRNIKKLDGAGYYPFDTMAVSGGFCSGYHVGVFFVCI
jgi:hypothetical protein